MMISDRRKLRIIANSVCFYTTAKSVRAGLGDSDDFNYAAQKTLSDLDAMYGKGVTGLVQHVGDFNIQINVV